jgi:hypothetical protein
MASKFQTIEVHQYPLKEGHEGPVGQRKFFKVWGLWKSTLTKRQVDQLGTAEWAARLQLLKTTPVAAEHGGEVPGSYGYPAATETVVAVAVGSDVFLFGGEENARGVTLRKCGAAVPFSCAEDCFDGRKTKETQSRAKKTLLAEVRAKAQEIKAAARAAPAGQRLHAAMREFVPSQLATALRVAEDFEIEHNLPIMDFRIFTTPKEKAIARIERVKTLIQSNKVC